MLMPPVVPKRKRERETERSRSKQALQYLLASVWVPHLVKV